MKVFLLLAAVTLVFGCDERTCVPDGPCKVAQCVPDSSGGTTSLVCQQTDKEAESECSLPDGGETCRVGQCHAESGSVGDTMVCTSVFAPVGTSCLAGGIYGQCVEDGTCMETSSSGPAGCTSSSCYTEEPCSVAECIEGECIIHRTGGASCELPAYTPCHVGVCAADAGSAYECMPQQVPAGESCVLTDGSTGTCTNTGECHVEGTGCEPGASCVISDPTGTSTYGICNAEGVCEEEVTGGCGECFTDEPCMTARCSGSSDPGTPETCLIEPMDAGAACETHAGEFGECTASGACEVPVSTGSGTTGSTTGTTGCGECHTEDPCKTAHCTSTSTDPGTETCVIDDKAPGSVCQTPDGVAGECSSTGACDVGTGSGSTTGSTGACHDECTTDNPCETARCITEAGGETCFFEDKAEGTPCMTSDGVHGGCSAGDCHSSTGSGSTGSTGDPCDDCASGPCVAATCTATGGCVTENKLDGTLCHMEDAVAGVASTGTCDAGVCTAVASGCVPGTTDCTSDSPCHVASCVASTRECALTQREDGATCDGGRCLAGHCEAEDPVDCSSCESTECRTASCEAGSCTFTDVADGADCGTGTTSGSCAAGVCSTVFTTRHDCPSDFEIGSGRWSISCTDTSAGAECEAQCGTASDTFVCTATTTGSEWTVKGGGDSECEAAAQNLLNVASGAASVGASLIVVVYAVALLF